MKQSRIDPGSFKDPSGFVYLYENVIYRQVNLSYKEEFDCFMGSGLYELLTKSESLIPHADVPPPSASVSPDHYKTLRPETIPYVSYPYEWSFSQLKDAALLTLDIQKSCLKHGMTLKDASAYNIQFVGCRPVFIDTLSFRRYAEGEPWIAYRQFCQHFLLPLALMSYCDIRLNKLLQINLDGVPLDLGSSLLPLRSFLRPGILLHIHMHARMQARYNNQAIKAGASRKMSLSSMLGLIDSLYGAVNKLNLKPQATEWGEYYDNTNYTEASMKHKEDIVKAFAAQVKPSTAIDLGANTGFFSKLVHNTGAYVVSSDYDGAAVEKNYLDAKRARHDRFLTLNLDLVQPSPGIGWNLRERQSLVSRTNCDLVTALALIHHLSISNNIPFEHQAAFFKQLGEYLIVEFIPKDDSQVQRLLTSREDIFVNYNQDFFEKAYEVHYEILHKEKITDSARVVYLMRRKNAA